MRPEEELIKKRASKKRKKTRNRRLKVVLVMVTIIAIISLVFYYLDNPDFIIGIRDKITSLYFSATGTTSVEDDTSVEDKEAAEVEGTDTNSKIPAFIQNIVTFFKQRMPVEEEIYPSKIEIKVYFASLGQQEKFTYEKREINASSKKIAVENVMKELIAGPIKQFNFAVIPPGTELLGVEIYENLAKVDLSQDFLENSLDSHILDEYVIYTIVNTVTQVPGIEGVVFLIDGKRIKIYGDVDLSIPAIKNEKYIEEE